METKTIALNQIKESKEIYPRQSFHWQTAYKYKEEMLAGANFPNIAVAEYAGSYHLIDGKHRMEAYKMAKEENVTVDIVKVDSEKEIYLKAIQANISHGLPLSVYDKANAVQRLKQYGYSDIQVSEIIRIPVDKIDSFMAKRMTNSITGEEIILKAPLKNLSNQEIGTEVDGLQSIITGKSANSILDQFIVLLETGSFNLHNYVVMNRLKTARKLIEEKVLSIRKTT